MVVLLGQSNKQNQAFVSVMSFCKPHEIIVLLFQRQQRCLWRCQVKLFRICVYWRCLCTDAVLSCILLHQHIIRCYYRSARSYTKLNASRCRRQTWSWPHSGKWWFITRLLIFLQWLLAVSDIWIKCSWSRISLKALSCFY